MNLRDFLAQFADLDPELTVCLGDWSGDATAPSSSDAALVRVEDIGTHFVTEDTSPTGPRAFGSFVLIGRGPHYQRAEVEDEH